MAAMEDTLQLPGVTGEVWVFLLEDFMETKALVNLILSLLATITLLENMDLAEEKSMIPLLAERPAKVATLLASLRTNGTPKAPTVFLTTSKLL